MAENKAEDYSYLMTEQDAGVLKNLTQMGEHLKKLNIKMLEAQAAAEQAKKEYEHYANNVMPMAMHSAGLEDITLASGGKMSIKRAYYCSPNKNAADQAIMREWLINNGGEHLIKDNAIVDGSSISDLEKNGVPYARKTEVNTTSLKAFLRDKLGVTSGVAQITIDDIPACMHFQEVTTIELSN